MKRLILLLIFGFSSGITLPLTAQTPRSARSATEGANREELRARRMIDSATSLLESGQHERGISMLEAVGNMFPDSKARFRAALELARYFQETSKYEDALEHLRGVRDSEDPAELAEAWYRIGAVQFEQARYNEAFSSLRRVTNDYPESTWTNYAYDIIGQGHFKQGRWGKAVEAFQMVGTAVPSDLEQDGEVLAEAGQRLFIKVTDKDLRILNLLGEDLQVKLKAESGDSETVPLLALGRAGEDWLASVRMASEGSQPNDGILSVQGGESISVTYIDHNNASGDRDVKLGKTVRIVSTGRVNFTDGAYNRNVRGLFAGQPAYIRLTDLDLDISDAMDTVSVSVTALYAVEPEEESAEDALAVDVTNLDDEQEVVWEERGRLEVSLTETAPHSGEFRGSFRPVEEDTDPVEGPSVVIQPNDKLELRYVDETHLRSRQPEERNARVRVVVGGSTDPESIVSVANDPDTQARKLLIEAQLLHRWGSIFKNVGLDSSAYSKAEEGLVKVEEILQLTARESIDRTLLEQSFATKWDLFLVQGKLKEAIATCQALVRLFPDTALVDQAFMNIARARSESEDPKDKWEAVRVYGEVIDLPESELKAQAQFRIAEIKEDLIKMSTKAGTQPNFAPAMVEYQRCADTYPNSPFAGEAFNKIINYHIGLRDYVRAVELMDRVTQDYPDAPWLDEILLKWGVVAFRMGNQGLAVQKFMQVLEQYPNGPSATKASDFLAKLR